MPNRGAAPVERHGHVGHGGQLPAMLSTFVGRRQELGVIKRLLAESRLVTLTGIGGVGKTRSAQQVAAQVRREFSDGVWFVDLTAVRDPALLSDETNDPEVLAHLVTTELGLRQSSGRSALGLLTGHLVHQSVLLVLDNCEHLLPACARLVDALLRECPGLRILATSREPLHVAGEMLFTVPPLPVPPEVGATEPSAFESMTLFVDRGAAAGFQVNPEHHAEIAEICRRLEGLPLALELAASWLPVLAPGQILDRLTGRYSVLSRGRRSAPERQQTLQACIDWSYEMCSKPERILWARLSVFVGGCELDAIEGVCADEQLHEDEVLDVVAGLVDKSVLIRSDQGDTRYRMLETLREYGQQRLDESGEHDSLRRRHRDWYQRLVRQASAEWVSDRQEHWYACLGRTRSNLHAAVEYCLTEPGEAEAALDIAVSLPLFHWWGWGLFGEGRRWLDLALARTQTSTPLRARGLLLNSHLAAAQGDVEAAIALQEQGEQLANQLGDPTARAHAAYARGSGALFAGEYAASSDAFQRAWELLALVSEPDPDLRTHLLLGLAVSAALVRDREGVDGWLREIRAMTQTGYTLQQTMWIHSLVAWILDDLDEADQYARNYLRTSRQQGLEDQFMAGLCLETLAWVAARRRRHRRAATLLGVVDSVFAGVGMSIDAYQHLIGYHRECDKRTRAALGDSGFHRHVDQGRGLSYTDALAVALEETRATEQQEPGPLTRREREVAQLVAEGLTNKQIAARLVISRRTAEAHVENILTKLSFRSRTQIAAWIADQRPTKSPAS